MSSLADRIRGVVGAVNPQSEIRPSTSSGRPEPVEGRNTAPNLECLDGAWQGEAFVVERRWEPGARHGREEIGAVAARLDEASGDAVLFAGGAARPPFVFFDLETTGLSGGAGTLAFLVGCAWFEADGAFTTRQFLLTRYAEERPLLAAAAAELARAGALVSFNGKSFDAPLLETRYLFHRLGWVGAGMPHLDVLHPARQFWKSEGEESACSLQAFERHIIGARRVGDVPGFEIPARYFQFVRSGDARPLEAVLEHNRLDLLTLAALTSRLLHLARMGHDEARDAREALALGRAYARASRQPSGAPDESAGAQLAALDERACAAFRHAVAMSDRAPAGAPPTLVKIDSLRMLALALRRGRRYVDAAACWRRILDLRGCPPQIAREATEALAIHHEHRERDLSAAKAFALQSLVSGQGPARTGAAQHRLARLEKKIGKYEVRRLKYEG